MNLGSQTRTEKYVQSTVDISTEQYRDMWEGGTAPPDLGANLLKYLPMLPKVEAEIFWLMVAKRKNQKDAARLLGMSESTVGYRCRRALDKLLYLATVSSVDVRKLLGEIGFMKEKEREVLADLFYTANQDLTGRRFNIRQSSVKWILMKTKRRVEALEVNDESWSNRLGILLLLERNLGVRIHY